MERIADDLSCFFRIKGGFARALCLPFFIVIFSVTACSQSSPDGASDSEEEDESLVGASATDTEGEEPTLPSDEDSDSDASEGETEISEPESFGDGFPPKGCDKKKTFFKDRDHDGYGDSNLPKKLCFLKPPFVDNNTDCNDQNPQVHPNRKDCEAIWRRTFFGECVLETVANGIDNDCDGATDEELECGDCSPPSELNVEAPPAPPHLDSPSPQDSPDEIPSE